MYNVHEILSYYVYTCYYTIYDWVFVLNGEINNIMLDPLNMYYTVDKRSPNF